MLYQLGVIHITVVINRLFSQLSHFCSTFEGPGVKLHAVLIPVDNTLHIQLDPHHKFSIALQWKASFDNMSGKTLFCLFHSEMGKCTVAGGSPPMSWDLLKFVACLKEVFLLGTLTKSLLMVEIVGPL